MELLAVGARIRCGEAHRQDSDKYSREVPLGAFRVRQSPSSGVSRDSCLPLMLPVLLCTDSSGAEGLNLLPMVQFSSLSAAPT